MGPGIASTNMAGQDELAQLEAERDQLLSMIAYHNGPFYRPQPGSRAPTWFLVVAGAGIFGIGVTMLAGVFAGQISASSLLFPAVGLPLLAYILTRKIIVFGAPLLVGEIVALFSWPPFVTPGPPAGESQTRQRLAECEARIMELQQGRS